MRINFISLQKRTGIYFLVGWLLFAILMLWGSCLRAATPVPLDEAIRQVLTEHLISEARYSSFQENKITSMNIRTIVRNNLDSGLLNSVLKTTGTDFRFIHSREHAEAQVGVLILSYPDEKIVSYMSKRLDKMGGYFRRTKILTRFSCMPIGKQLVISFTENAGDEDIVKFINEFPESFKALQY
jgi:hypothetical protein